MIQHLASIKTLLLMTATSVHLPECQSGCPTSRSHQQVEQTNPVAKTLCEFWLILFVRQHLNHSELDSHGFEGFLQSSITLASPGRDVSNQQVDLLEIRLRQPRHDSEALKCRCLVEKPQKCFFFICQRRLPCLLNTTA